MILTAELLLHYQRCNRRTFLDVHGERRKLDPPSNFLLKLQQDRLAHQKSVLADTIYHQPHYPKKDWQAGFQATLALMQQGVEQIYRGVLLHKERDEEEEISLSSSSPTTFLSFPDLLVKQPGNSVFGDWIYIPVQIELGKRPKQEYKISVAFHAQVLAQVQGVSPPTAWLVLREKKMHSVQLEHWVLQMQKIWQECRQMLSEAQIPEVFISRQKCNLCHWYNHCYEVAKSEEHLSLLPSVTPSRYSYLKELNLTTVASLANANFDELEEVFGEEITLQMLRQAQSKLENKVIFNADLCVNFPNSSIELYFDIESQPDVDFAYLLGVLVVDREAKTKEFYAFLAEESAEEGMVWRDFLELVWKFPEAPIYHFCDYELLMVRELADRYQTPNELWEPVQYRLVDVHQALTQAVTMHIESYSLKAIARWLGFEWRDPSANGSQAICWYDEWLKKGDRAFLNRIVQYNEDDCLATYRVKDWLANILQ